MTTSSTAMATPMKSKARPFGIFRLIYIMIRKPHLQHNALPKHCQNMTKGLYYHSLFTTLDISKAKFLFFQRAVNTPRAAASLQPDMRKGITYKTTTRY